MTSCVMSLCDRARVRPPIRPVEDRPDKTVYLEPTVPGWSSLPHGLTAGRPVSTSTVVSRSLGEF